MTRSSTDLFGAILLLSAFGMVSLDASGGTAPAPAAAEVARAAEEANSEATEIADHKDTYCARKLNELLNPGNPKLEEGATKPADAKVAATSALVITAPNALAHDTAPVFDSIVEAVVTTMMESDFVRDRSWFPTRAAQEGPAYCPGLMMFRKKAERRVIFWVPESSLSGLNREVMKSVLALIEKVEGQRPELAVIGPYYSASAPSLARSLRESGTSFCYRVASGTLQVPTARDALKRELAELAKQCKTPPPAFASNAPPLGDRLLEVQRFLGRQHEDKQSIAIVQESGTTYGGGQTKDSGKKLFAIQYPPQIAALRQAHAAQQKKRAASENILMSNSELLMPTEQLTLSAEGLPTFAPQETSLVHDLALRDAGRLLKEKHIGDAIITGVLSQDIVFLAQRLKRESPDLRVVLYQMDRLFTASAFANDLRGALVVTPYPSFIEDPSGSHTTYSRDSARSVAEVLRGVLTKDDKRKPQPDKRMSIGVLSGGRLWPLYVKRVDGAAVQRLSPEHGAIPTMFKSFSCLVLAFGALNMLLLWVLQWKRDKASEQEQAKKAGARPSVENAQASAAWFLKGQLATSDPVVRPMHASMVVTAQCALAALLALQAQLWFVLMLYATPGWQTYGRFFMFFFNLVLASACLGFAKRAARGLMEPPLDPHALMPADRELAKSIRLWGRVLGVLLPLAIAAMTASAMYGIGVQIGANGSIFLDRLLNLTSGVSPYYLVALALGFLYGLGTTHAGRMRVIEVASPAERVVVSIALSSGSLLEARERELYASALLPGGVRYVIATLVSIAAPVLIVVQVRPGVIHHLHDFTLESRWLSISIAIGMIICWCGTVLAAALTVRLWRALSEVLHALLTSDLGASFEKLPQPFARSTAELLALGPHDLAEVEALKHTLQSAVLAAGLGVPSLRPSDAALSPRMTSAMSAPGFLDAKLGAASARFLLDQGVKAKAAERLRKALATYVAFGLTRWIKQFRFLMWLSTLGTTTMLLMSSGYVFSVRKLLVTLSVLLTVSVVAAVAVVFVGLERNRVLSFIGGSEPGVAIQANLVRILGWAVLPVTIAVASYFPDTMRVLIEWTMTMGGGR